MMVWLSCNKETLVRQKILVLSWLLLHILWWSFVDKCLLRCSKGRCLYRAVTYGRLQYFVLSVELLCFIGAVAYVHLP